MSQQLQPSGFQERIGQVRDRLAERLRAFRPGPRTYATAFCVGATIGEYAAQAGSTDPAAVLTAVTALGSALGVNLLADIIGDREPPPGLTTEDIAEAVQERLEQGEDLPAVRTLLQEFGTFQLALETWWQAEDERWQQLVNELSRHPQLVAAQVTQDVVTALDPRLVTLDKRTQRIVEMLDSLAQVNAQEPVDVQRYLRRVTQAQVNDLNHDYASEAEILKRRLAMARKALAILEEQAAGFGSLHIPAHLKIELEAKREEVAQLEAQLRSKET